MSAPTGQGELPLNDERLIDHDAEHREAMASWAEGASLDEAIAFSIALLDRVQAETKATHALTATLGLFSGGNDSTTFMHLFRDRFDSAVHVDTGIGVRETDAYVRSTCAAWDMPLIVGHPPPGVTYPELVARWGFPGPAGHGLMYTRLKERAFRQVRSRFVTNGRKERVLFVAGMRYFESDRRKKNTQETHSDGSTVWCSPLTWWTDRHMTEYRERFDVPRNEVSDNLHMSGECLCGAFAAEGELEHLRFFYPETAAYIDELQAMARANKVHCIWGTRPPPHSRTGRPKWVCLCGSFHDTEPGCPRGTWAVPPKDAMPEDESVGPLCARCEIQPELFGVSA